MDKRLPPRYTSLETLQQNGNSSANTGNVLVKKRHSTYSLAPPSQTPTPPLPTNDQTNIPSRPPRFPARHYIPPPSPSSLPFPIDSSDSLPSTSGTTNPTSPPFLSRKPKGSPIPPYSYRTGKRPSTADSVFAPSFASRASALSTHSGSSGGSRDKDKEKERKQVTPWEFQELMEDSEREVAVPAHLVDVTLGGSMTSPTGLGSGAPVPDVVTGGGQKLTGRVEEVTPWEMHAPPPLPPPSPARSEFSSSSHSHSYHQHANVGFKSAAGGGGGRARSSTNTSNSSYASNASTSTSSSAGTGKSVGKNTSASGSSTKSVGSMLTTPTPYAMRFSPSQTQIPHPGVGGSQDQAISPPPLALSLSILTPAMASTSTLGSVGSFVHRQQDQHAHFPSPVSPNSGEDGSGDWDNNNNQARGNTNTPLPLPPSPLRSAPSMSSLKSSLSTTNTPAPSSTTSTTTTTTSNTTNTTPAKRVPMPLPLRAAPSTRSIVAPSIASAGSTLSTTSASSREKVVGGIGGSGSTGTIEDVTPWELYPAPALPSSALLPGGDVTSPPPLPSMPTTPGGRERDREREREREKEKERKRRSSISMSLEERRKSASGGVAGALSSMSMGLGLSLGRTKTREREKDKERERNGSLVAQPPTPTPFAHPPPGSAYSPTHIHSQMNMHANALPVQQSQTQQQQQQQQRPEIDKEARVATGLKEDVTPWELSDVVPVPRRVGGEEDTVQYVEVAERKKSASGTPTPVTATLGLGLGVEGGMNTSRARGSMTLEQMAEVMPWELYPIPTETGSGSFPPAVEGGMGIGISSSGVGGVMSQVLPPPPSSTTQEKFAQKGYQTQASGGKSTTGSATPSVSTTAFAEFGLKRRKSAGGGTATSVRPRTAGDLREREREREREAVAAVSNALAGSSPLPGSSSQTSSSSSGQTSSKESTRDRSRLSGLVGISSHDVNLNGLPQYHHHQHQHPHPHPYQQHPVPASPSYVSGNAGSTSPVASSSGHFGGGAGISSSSSSLTHVNHGSISSSTASTITATTTATAKASSLRPSGVKAKNPASKFSTADRTILEQIKAGIKAREAQFVVKGVGHIVPGGGRSEGKKYHPFPRQVVPYPRSYGKEVLDLDIWETQFCMDLCDSWTWHVFEKPPTRVLDLGCGTGTWIMHCAKVWKECHFVGLDIVPLHPDLQVLGSPDLASRITWIQHNFLEGLPFQKDEFDFVHIKRIALGVPEDKWDKLLDEIARVMKPGAVLEMIEEDLDFPGKRKDETDDVMSTRMSQRDDASSITRQDSISSSDRYSTDKFSELDEPTTPTSAHVIPSGRLPSRPSSPTRSHAHGSRLDVNKGFEDYPNSKSASTSSVPASIVTPHSRSTSRPSLTVKTPKGAVNSYPPMPANSSMYGASVGILGGMGYMASEDPLMTYIKEEKMRAAAAASALHLPSKKTPTLSKSRVDPDAPSTSKIVTDPRDHTILEAIWNGMLDARFVNRTPLSIVATYMDYHFSDVRTHPPVVYTFPISHPTEYWDSDPESDSDSDSEEEEELPPPPPTPPREEEPDPDVDGARDAIVPRPQPVKSGQPPDVKGGSIHKSQWDEVEADSPWKDLQRRLERCYPFITLDATRVWSRKSPHSGAGLPNTTLKLDVKSLNQHLALRAKEVIACSESMWEWVQERQSMAEKEAAHGVRYRSGSASIETYMVGASSTSDSPVQHLTQNAILEMTRDDFNHLMNNFHLDMEDKASLGHALQERFDWHVFQSHVTQDRRAFNKACRKYDRWVARKIRRAKRAAAGPYRQSNAHRSRNSMSASAPGLVLPASELSALHDYNLISRSSSTPQPSVGDHRDDTSSIITAVNSRHDSRSSQPHPPSTLVPQNFSLSQLSPEQRQSRAIRVFVAWKAS